MPYLAAGGLAYGAEQPLDRVKPSSSQYLSIRYSERLAKAGAQPSVGSVRDSYDNALAETSLAFSRSDPARLLDMFTSATALVTALTKAHHAGRLEERLVHYATPKLLITDEVGYLPLEANVARLFFQLVSRRYERGSMLVTSNRAVSEWGTVFGDAVVATAILDRLLHHSHVITIRGDSYRLREKRRSGLMPQRSTDKELEKLT